MPCPVVDIPSPHSIGEDIPHEPPNVATMQRHINGYKGISGCSIVKKPV
jgi:hypothetical protein